MITRDGCVYTWAGIARGGIERVTTNPTDGWVEVESEAGDVVCIDVDPDDLGDVLRAMMHERHALRLLGLEHHMRSITALEAARDRGGEGD